MIFTFSKKTKLEHVPQGLQDMILQTAKQENKQEAVLCAYTLLAKRYRGYRFKTYTQLHKIFYTNIHKIWDENDDFIHCTTMNQLLRLVLIKSNHFCEEDIKQHWTLVWFVSPHQYLSVNLGKKVVSIDLWGAHNNIPISYYASGFGKKQITTMHTVTSNHNDVQA